MDARTSATSLEATSPRFGEPEVFVTGEATASVSTIPSACPACGSADLLSETALDAEEMPTGLLLVTCAACGRELGELAPAAPGREAEPEPLEGSLLPGPSEEPRGLERPAPRRAR